MGEETRPLYTKEIHAKRLSQMLQKEDPCGYCPSSEGFNPSASSSILWSSSSYPCRICRAFVGLKPDPGFGPRCPCNTLGRKKALQRTRKALKEFYQEEKQMPKKRLKNLPTYTKRLHAYRLSLMLKKDNPQEHCPAAKRFVTNKNIKSLWSSTNHPCRICAEFVDIPLRLIRANSFFRPFDAVYPNGLLGSCCPCYYYGRKEALRRTEEKLKEFYQKERRPQ